MTVLAGQPYSVECVGVQTERPSSSTLFFMGDVLNPATQFEYPSDPGVPFHVKTAVFTVEPSALFCTFGPPPGPGVSNTFSEWGALTVHSKSAITQLFVGFSVLFLDSGKHKQQWCGLAHHCIMHTTVLCIM